MIYVYRYIGYAYDVCPIHSRPICVHKGRVLGYKILDLRHSCHSGNNQKFYWDGKYLKSRPMGRADTEEMVAQWVSE